MTYFQWTYLHLIHISLLWTIYRQVWATCLTYWSNVVYIGTYIQIRVIFFILTRYLHILNGRDLFFIYNNFDMGDVYVMWLRTLWYGQDIARYMWHPFHMGYITYIWTRCADIDDSYFIKARYSSDFFNVSDKCLI